MTKHIIKFLHKAGMDNVPPSLVGFFHNDPLSPLLNKIKSSYFSSTNGALIYTFPRRGDFRKRLLIYVLVIRLLLMPIFLN